MRKSALLYCLLLAGCNESPAPPRAGHSAAVSGALSHLRESLNSGNCDLIYREASDEFRGLEPHDDWLETCRQLRAKLGVWEAFTVRSTDFRPSSLAHVYGTAAFSSGPCSFHAAWRLETGAARLFALWLQCAGQWVVVPPPRRIPVPDRLIDPPSPMHQLARARITMPSASVPEQRDRALPRT